MKALLHNIALFVLAIVFSVFTADFFVDFYDNVFHDSSSGGFLDFSYYVGLLFALPSFVALLFEFLGGRFRRVIIAVLCVPFVIFYSLPKDLLSFVGPVLFIITFFVIGWLLRKLRERNSKANSQTVKK